MFDDKKKVETPNVSKEENNVDDAVSDILYMSPDIFMAQATLELMNLPLATKRRRGKELAIDARNIAACQADDRYASRKWSKVSWNLSTLR